MEEQIFLALVNLSYNPRAIKFQGNILTLREYNSTIIGGYFYKEINSELKDFLQGFLGLSLNKIYFCLVRTSTL